MLTHVHHYAGYFELLIMLKLCSSTHIHGSWCVHVHTIELAMTKQTALESNLICGTFNQKLFTQCLARVYTACTQIQ